MSNVKVGNVVAEMKKKIAVKTKDFEKRLTDARNNFEIVKVLEEMNEILTAEVFSWTLLIEKEQSFPQTGSENLINNAFAEIEKLDGLMTTIANMHKELHESAFLIERVLVREGKLSDSVLKGLE